MAEWWNTLDLVLRVLYCIAVPSTLLLFLQIVLSVAGGFADGGAAVNPSDVSGIDFDMNTDVSTDVANWDTTVHPSGDGSGPHDGSILHLLTLQGVLSFLTVFGWASILAIQMGSHQMVSIIIGLVFGFIAMILVANLVQATRHLAENGSLDIKNAMGETGTVYLTIPAKGRGEGKVMVQVQGQLNECSAITWEEEDLKTGATVRVVDLHGEVLVVQREELPSTIRLSQ